MKKIKRIFYVLLGVSLLTGCGAPSMQEMEALNVKAVSNVQAAGQISDADTGTLQDWGYMAKQQDKIVINDDYDTCLKLCQDANNAYISLLKDKEQIMDFTDYLSDSNLAEYVQYRAKNYPNGVCAASGSFYLTNYESISNECVFIKGQISIQNGSTVENLGEAAFVLKNENGRIVIEDWYHNDPDSLDVMYRANEYECIRYVDFWECDEKYGPFMERIKSKAE